MFQLPLAENNATSPWTVLYGSLLAGLAVAWFSKQIFQIIYRSRPSNVQAWEFDARRHVRLRETSRIFCWFEPLIMEIKDCGPLQRWGQIDLVKKCLHQGASPLPWLADEYIATAALRGIVTASIVGVITCWLFGIFAAFLLAPVVILYCVRAAASDIQRQSVRRLFRFKRRLPFAVDLMALMLEAGGDFRQCLATVVHENQDHPVGEEFSRLLTNMSAGQPRIEALAAMRERLMDEDIHEIVLSVKNAEELGSPLSETFLTLADQMRQKRSQLAEKLVGKAQTDLNFPILLIMLACMLISLAPFVLALLASSPF